MVARAGLGARRALTFIDLGALRGRVSQSFGPGAELDAAAIGRFLDRSDSNGHFDRGRLTSSLTRAYIYDAMPKTAEPARAHADHPTHAPSALHRELERLPSVRMRRSRLRRPARFWPVVRGLAALLAMLNCCAPGVVVVNIDNGFGAGYYASMVNRMAGV